jgi:guanylate cyclase
LKIILPLLRSVNSSEDSQDKRFQKMITILTATFDAIPIHIFLGIVYLAFHEYVAAIMMFGFCALYVFGIILFRSQPKYYHFVKNCQLSSTIISPLLGTLLLGGIANASFSLAWGLVAPILSLLISNLREAFLWFLAFLLTIFVSVLSSPYLRTSNNIPDSIISIITSVSLIGISTLIFLASAFATYQRNILLKSLSSEKVKTENLLLNILPKEIAEILKNSDQPIADHFDEVTILFADIVGFTPMCSAMSAIETVEMLNRLYRK